VHPLLSVLEGFAPVGDEGSRKEHVPMTYVYMYVCISVCMYACMHVCMHAERFVWMLHVSYAFYAFYAWWLYFP
jgi:hypothetical protein